MLFVNIDESDHHLRITVRDRQWPLQIFLSVVALLVMALSMAASASNFGVLPNDEPGTPVGGAICLTAAAVSLYGLMAIWVNRTVVDIGPETIDVSRGPLVRPGHRRLSLATARVEQIFVQEERFNAPHEEAESAPVYLQYGIWAMLSSGERRCLLDLSALGFIADTFHQASPIYADTADAIEERIEAFLKIEDVPVANRIVDRLVPGPPTNSSGYS